MSHALSVAVSVMMGEALIEKHCDIYESSIYSGHVNVDVLLTPSIVFYFLVFSYVITNAPFVQNQTYIEQRELKKTKREALQVVVVGMSWRLPCLGC